MGIAFALLGAAFAAGFAGVGSALGISSAARTASGAMAEDPSKFGKFLLLIALPGTQGIYGFLIAFLMLLNLNFVGGAAIPQIATSTGWMYFFASLPIAITGLISGMYQGKVCAAGINMVTKQPGESGKSLVMAVLVEFYAILGFLISLFFVLKGVQ